MMTWQDRSDEHRREERAQDRAKRMLARAVANIPAEKRRQRHDRGSLRRRRVGRPMDTESNCSTTTWSYEIGPYMRSREPSVAQSREASRPSSACSHASGHSIASSHATSHASYVSARSSAFDPRAMVTEM